MDSKDEPYFVPEESDDKFDRIYWKVVGCPAAGCSDASFKKAFIRSFINRDRLIDYLALHLNRSSLHDYNQQEAYDTAADWVAMDENIEAHVETFADRQEYREQIKQHHRKAHKAASRARTPSRGSDESVQKRERGHGQHSTHTQRSQNQERSRSPRRDGNRLVWPPHPPHHPPPPNIVINTPGPISTLVSGSKAGIMSKQLPTKQTASTTAGSAGSAGDTVDKSQLQLLHDVLTRAQGALTAASKACEALRRTFHDESEVINEARAAVKTIMER
jgi:hypothetical protein